MKTRLLLILVSLLLTACSVDLFGTQYGIVPGGTRITFYTDNKQGFQESWVIIFYPGIAYEHNYFQPLTPAPTP